MSHPAPRTWSFSGSMENDLEESARPCLNTFFEMCLVCFVLSVTLWSLTELQLLYLLIHWSSVHMRPIYTFLVDLSELFACVGPSLPLVSLFTLQWLAGGC